MSIIALLKTPKLLIPVAVVAASSPFALHYSGYSVFSGKEKPLGAKAKAVLSSIKDRKNQKGMERYSAQPYWGLPKVVLYYTAKEVEQLKARASEWGYSNKVKNFWTVSAEQYSAWCDGLYIGEYDETKQEVKTWNEKCGVNGKKRSHVNQLLKISYPEGYYEKDSPIRKALEEDEARFKKIEEEVKNIGTTTKKDPIKVTLKECGHVFEKSNVQGITAPKACQGKEDQVISGTPTTTSTVSK